MAVIKNVIMNVIMPITEVKIPNFLDLHQPDNEIKEIIETIPK